jgi:FkbM family methyltransferase
MKPAEFIYTVMLKPRPLRIATNALLRAVLPRARKVNGAVVYLNPDDPVISGALTLGVYEKEEIAFFERVVEPEMVFVDVGANVGLYTALGLRRMRHPGRIICVEPDPASAAFLEQTIRSNHQGDQSPKVSFHQVALSDTQGEVMLHKNRENKGDNRIYSDALCTDAIQVASDTLDNLLEREGIDEINLIKIDVQGAEAKVVAGGRRVLQKSTDCVMMTEFWPNGLTNCGSSPSDYLTMLEDIGLSLYSLDGTILRPVLDHQALIASCPGRVYRNLVGIKGRFKDKL